MKPVLLGEERLEDMRDAHCVGYHCGCAYIGSRDIGHCVACKVRRDFLAGARAALAELGVEKVIDVPAECHGCKWDDAGAQHPLPGCMLNGDEVCPEKGAVLVRKGRGE